MLQAQDPQRRPPQAVAPDTRRGPWWWRSLWVAAGVLSLVLGVVGIFLPLLPTVPFVLLAGFCFARGSRRAEAWLLSHPGFGPMVQDWRAHRALPLRLKRLAWTMMAVGALWAWWVLPAPWRWVPAPVCLAVGVWMWTLPTRH